MDSITISDLMHLAPDERRRIAEALWDSVAADAEASPSLLPLSEAQWREIDRRSAAYRADPGRAIPLDQALEHIESSLG